MFKRASGGTYLLGGARVEPLRWWRGAADASPDRNDIGIGTGRRTDFIISMYLQCGRHVSGKGHLGGVANNTTEWIFP